MKTKQSIIEMIEKIEKEQENLQNAIKEIRDSMKIEGRASEGMEQMTMMIKAFDRTKGKLIALNWMIDDFEMQDSYTEVIVERSKVDAMRALKNFR